MARDATKDTTDDTETTAVEAPTLDAVAPKHNFFVRLYTGTGADVRLNIQAGRLDLASLDVPGLASGALPAFDRLDPLAPVRAAGSPP